MSDRVSHGGFKSKIYGRGKAQVYLQVFWQDVSEKILFIQKGKRQFHAGKDGHLRAVGRNRAVV